jgi:hypothetical protein
VKGFDPRWKDLPDYILGITKEIWEDRNVRSLDHYYGRDMIKRSPDGVLRGNQAVIRETAMSIGSVPDLQLYGEDVIWSGDEEAGFLSSHRLICVSTHVADGPWGPATGKRTRNRVIADCWCKDDAIHDEWLIYDTGAATRQIGLSPAEAARLQILDEGGVASAERPFTMAMDVVGPYTGRGNDNIWGQRHAGLLQAIFAADFAALAPTYDRAVQLDLPGGRTEHGQPEADRFWTGVKGCFPDAKLTVEHVIGREDPMFAPRSAVRWNLQGRHDGWGLFGRPTGAEVFVWGVCHADWGPWGPDGYSIRRETVIFDEVAIWKQIHLHTGV